MERTGEYPRLSCISGITSRSGAVQSVSGCVRKIRHSLYRILFQSATGERTDKLQNAGPARFSCLRAQGELRATQYGHTQESRSRRYQPKEADSLLVRLGWTGRHGPIPG